MSDTPGVLRTFFRRKKRELNAPGFVRIRMDRRPLAVWSNFFFQAKKKEAKKSLVTTTAAVSQAPQRF